MPAPQEAPIHACECPICQTGSDRDIAQRHYQMNVLLSRLTEPQRRWYVGFLSQEPNSPSDRQLALISGLDKNTIQRGRRELDAGLADVPLIRQRRAGAGRPSAQKKNLSSKP